MSTLGALLELLYSARWYIGTTLVTLYFASLFRAYWRLSHIKGPWLAQFSDLWLLGAIYRQQDHLEFYDLTKKYGTLARIGTNTLVTSDTDLVNRMNATRSPYTRSDWYLGFRLFPGTDNVFSTRDEKVHTKRRGQMNLGYTGKENINFEPKIDLHVASLIRLIRTKYLSSVSSLKSMDLAEKCSYFTIDVTTDLSTGVAFGSLESDSDKYDYLRSSTEALPALSLLSSLKTLNKFFHLLIQIPSIGKKLLPTADDEIGLGKMIGIAQKQVAGRFHPTTEAKIEQPDIIQSFINHGLNQDETTSESILLVLAGADMTASVIRAIMLYIITSPKTYATLRAEIDGASLSTPVVRDEEARALVYLQAVILEGIRMHPPVGGLLPKLTPPEGDTINGIFVPGGTEIASNTWGMLRNKHVFGPDAEFFRPERWLNISEGKYAEMFRVADLAFGSGRFKCLGRTIAMMELNKIFVEFLRNFDWAVVDATNPWKSANIGVVVHRDFYVRVTERTASD